MLLIVFHAVILELDVKVPGQRKGTETGKRGTRTTQKQETRRNYSSVGKVRLEQGKGRNCPLPDFYSIAELQQVTREWIKFVSRTLRYCSSQEIALREHRFENDNKGNFVGAVDLVLKHSQELRDLRTKLPLNAHYLSPEPQNELLRCMADMVQSVTR